MGMRQGNRVGNLVILPQIKPHREFRLEGMDVVSNLRVTLLDALQGKVVVVNTMFGDRELVIPQASRPGDRLGIPGCGVGGQGNHWVLLVVDFPDRSKIKDFEGFKLNEKAAPKPPPQANRETWATHSMTTGGTATSL
jgi:molecular chaperone DnaJ